jgi:hypothetical protein
VYVSDLSGSVSKSIGFLIICNGTSVYGDGRDGEGLGAKIVW